MIKNEKIDRGKPFDWGKTSEDYAKYRDIYPEIFYKIIVDKGLCINGQQVLDIGTGTGVLPRNMYKYGAEWTGTDISENQITEAKAMAKAAGMDIVFFTCPAEETDFPKNTFDTVTACQCIWYPDHKILAPKLANIIKPDGKFVILYMGWLPFEDKIAAKSEEIILKYSPNWTGAGDTVHPVWVPDEYADDFEIVDQEETMVKVPFTRESWNGRMRACRGVGASLSKEKLKEWNKEHMAMLEKEAPQEFEVLHYISIAVLQNKKVV